MADIIDLGKKGKTESDKEESINAIIISEEDLAELENDSLFLDCLKEAGVDNWDGYDNAINLFNEYCDQINNGEYDNE